MPLSLTAGSGEGLRAELLGLGLELLPMRNSKPWLLEYLISANPAQRARYVSHIGWHGDIFVLPDETIGADDAGEKVILQSTERLDHAFNIGGTLADWKKDVTGTALGNSRLVLSISAAFAAPMLALTGEEGGGFHFRGSSSTGKSTALVVAGSVWGGGGTRGFVRQWRATDNALESVAALSSDTLLCLDELSQVDAKAAGVSAYMLANGKGKARAGREGQARKVLEWRVLFLSNGEIALADKIKEGGGRIAAGMEVRVIDVRADAGADLGIFEDIHNAPDPATFSQNLKRAANTSFGHAGRGLVAALAKDLVRFRDEIATLRRMFMESTLPDGADGQVRRVADRFALVAAAGEIASGLKLTGWPAGTAKEAAQRCFQDWLQERGGIGSSEVAEARRRIAEALQSHGTSRFQRWAKSSSDRMVITNRLGFVKVEGNADVEEVESTFYFLPEPFKELLSGLDFRTIVAELIEAGVIVSQNGKPNKPFHVSSGGGKFRLYEINSAALEEKLGRPDA
jgi:putative DNA primase/helicase